MTEKEKTPCSCPYCDTPLFEDISECKPCSAKVIYCHKCGKPLPKDASYCPECGQARPDDKKE